MSTPTVEEMLEEAKHYGYIDAPNVDETRILIRYYQKHAEWSDVFFGKAINAQDLKRGREYAVQELANKLAWDAQENFIKGVNGSAFGDLLKLALRRVDFKQVAQEVIGEAQVWYDGKFVPDDTTDEKKLIDYYKEYDFYEERILKAMAKEEESDKKLNAAIEELEGLFSTIPLRVQFRLKNVASINWEEVVNALIEKS